MPRANSICLAKGCLVRTFRDGRCREHQLRKPWQNVSARNQNRPSNWASIKAQVLVRDGFTCQMCGGRSDLEVDHIIPVAKGGSWEKDNLWVLCKEDHLKKSKKFDRGS